MTKAKKAPEGLLRKLRLLPARIRPFAVRADIVTTGDILWILRDLGIIISTLLFFTGWTYTAALFSHLGLKFATFDQSIHHILIYSAAPLVEAYQDVMFDYSVIGAVLMLWILLRIITFISKKLTAVRYDFLATYMIILFIVMYHWSNQTANAIAY